MSLKCVYQFDFTRQGRRDELGFIRTVCGAGIKNVQPALFMDIGCHKQIPARGAVHKLVLLAEALNLFLMVR